MLSKDWAIIFTPLRGKSAHALTHTYTHTQSIINIACCVEPNVRPPGWDNATFLCVNLFADSVRRSSTGSGESSLLVTVLSKKRFVPWCTCGFYLTRRPVICYTCVDLSPARPTPSLLRSIVFVLYANVYQRVPTVRASTYKVMYWHGRFLRDRAELATYGGCEAEGRLGGGATQQSQRGRRKRHW